MLRGILIDPFPSKMTMTSKKNQKKSRSSAEFLTGCLEGGPHEGGGGYKWGNRKQRSIPTQPPFVWSPINDPSARMAAEFCCLHWEWAQMFNWNFAIKISLKCTTHKSSVFYVRLPLPPPFIPPYIYGPSGDPEIKWDHKRVGRGIFPPKFSTFLNWAFPMPRMTLRPQKRAFCVRAKRGKNRLGKNQQKNNKPDCVVKVEK